ncbi:MAG: hypothetical protein CR217_17355 [Beijerinckiaceae bacterium]|nr:MAG: hypothetical protein CR217_17355 [Beijerinckiaceae bacterium]
MSFRLDDLNSVTAADSTIEQTIRMRTNQLTPAANDDAMEKIFEERQRKALLEIERLNSGEAPEFRKASKH